MSTEKIDNPGFDNPVDGRIQVDVIYAQPGSVWRRSLCLPRLSTVHQALVQSRFFEQFPEHHPASVNVGIYGQACTLDRSLQQNDRVEVYRPLIFDPMESRRRRAQHRKRNKQKGKMSPE